jgi:hypothetical protein
VLVLWLTRGLWILGIGRGLVCDQWTGSGDAILIENFDQEYLPFERAAELRRNGVASRVLVATTASSNPAEPNLVSARIVEVMASVARLPPPEMIPIREVEPISLNVAYQVRDFLQKQHVRSVVVVTPAFRSRRSSLVYEAVLGRTGITPRCVPVFAEPTTETWTKTWHGVQQVVEQQVKLQYYRFFVLPQVVRRAG